MKLRHIMLAAIGVGIIAMALPVTSQAQIPDVIYVKGTVTISSRPLVSAWVVLSQNGRETRRFLTDDNGSYLIGRISPGVYDIAVLTGTVQRFRAQINLPKDTVFDIKI